MWPRRIQWIKVGLGTVRPYVSFPATIKPLPASSEVAGHPVGAYPAPRTTCRLVQNLTRDVARSARSARTSGPAAWRGPPAPRPACGGPPHAGPAPRRSTDRQAEGGTEVRWHRPPSPSTGVRACTPAPAPPTRGPTPSAAGRLSHIDFGEDCPLYSPVSSNTRARRLFALL